MLTAITFIRRSADYYILIIYYTSQLIFCNHNCKDLVVNHLCNTVANKIMLLTFTQKRYKQFG